VIVGVQMAALGADQAPQTLLGSCGSNPGLTCQLVWDLSHNRHASLLTSEFLSGPVHLLLRVIFVVVLALIIQALVHRVITRLTERATHSILPHLRGGATAAAARRAPARLVQRRRDTSAAEAAAADATAMGAASARGIAEDCAGEAGQGMINGAAAQAERALIDERRKQRVRALGQILRSIASVTILSIATVVILGDLGINLAPLLASAGVVGIAIGFGAQSMVRDYLAGIFMLVEDQYGVGDVITIGDATGTVENVTLRLTKLRDVSGIVWHIRNGAIEQVGNESQGWARAVIDFPVPYEVDLAEIQSLLTDATAALWDDPVWRVVLLDPPEVWGAQEISSSEVTVRIVAKTAPLRQWEVERELRARVKAAIDAAGIQPTPSKSETGAKGARTGRLAPL
jgi:small-conductance mechanosensitive channel